MRDTILNSSDTRLPWLTWVFVFGGLGAILAGPVLANQQVVLMLLVFAVIAGLPHGGLDVIVIRQLGGTGQQIGITALYLGFVLVVIAVWWQFPLWSLTGFLAISIYHFGQEDTRGAIGHARSTEALARGGAVIVLPAVFHGERTAELFGWLSSAQGGEWLVDMIVVIAPLWALLMLTAVLISVRQKRRADLAELLMLGLLFASLPPLPAFAVYFALLHSPRSMQRLRRATLEMSALSWWAHAALPTILVLLAAASWWVGAVWTGSEMAALQGFDIEPGLIRLVFISLAALTLPHVLLWEWVMKKPG